MRRGELQDKLGTLLECAGMPPSSTTAGVVARPSLRDLPTLGGEILELYHRLGGVQNTPRLLPGDWDMLAGGILVELDEDQHFNRYRALTLTPTWTDQLPWAEPYRQWCVTGEPICLRHKSGGGFWTNDPSQRQFGPAGPPGDLDHPGGSPRWKQRALYDAIRDAYALEPDHRPLARVSIHDTIDGNALGQILAGQASCSSHALVELVRSRAVTAGA